MIDVIEIIVSINGAEATVSEQIYSNNVNQYRALVRFEDESWENYDKMIVFDRVKNYDTPIGIMVNEDNKDFIEVVDNRSFYCIIPWEVLTQPGYFNISIHGVLNDSHKSISVKDKITVYDGGNATIYPRVPTPNIYEQLVKLLDNKEEVDEVKNRLEEIDNKLDNQPTNYVFDDLEELDNRLLDEEFVDKLIIGDNFLIRDNDVPDYWWDGVEKLPIEGEKIELPEMVGQVTENGGEIFNDYENNKALSEYSSASGWKTKATALAQFVVGKANAEDSNALFIVGNGSSNTDRKNAFVVNKDGSAIVQTTGIGDLNVVNYRQLKDYVAKNKGSTWDNQSEMLFSTGALKILNHVPTSESANDGDYGIYLDNNYSDNAKFTSQKLYLESRGYGGSASLTYNSLIINARDFIPYISLEKLNSGNSIISLEINTERIIYNSYSIYWEDLYNTVEGFEKGNYVGPEGPQGIQGEPGIGISNTQINDDGQLEIIYSNDTMTNVGKVVGPEGPQGIQGIQGIQGEPGEKGEPGDDYILTEADKEEIMNMVLENFVDVSEVGQ